MARCSSFFRNEDLNARNYFAQAGARPEFRRNQYGVTVGGPIRKNKDVLLRRLARDAIAHRNYATECRSDVDAAGGDFYHRGLRSGYFAARSVPEQHDSHQPYRSDCVTGVAALSTAECGWREQLYKDGGGARCAGSIRWTAGSSVQREASCVSCGIRTLRDNDTPVTFLPDGSGNLTSGVIGHAITRGDGACVRV